MRQYVVHPNLDAPMDSEQPHIGPLQYAREFADAASVIVSSGEAYKTLIATMYLCGHAIELAMKSILVKNGVPLKELKEIGHDLEKCLEKAASYPEGDNFEDRLRAIIELLNRQYEKKHFEYHPGSRFMTLPEEASMCKEVSSFIGLLDSIYRAESRSRR